MNGKSPIVRCLARLKIFCSSLLSVIICGSGLKMLIADRPSHKPSYSVAACCLEIKSLIHTKTAADSQDTSIILIGLHADKYFEIHLKLQDILLSFFRNFILYFYWHSPYLWQLLCIISYCIQISKRKIRSPLHTMSTGSHTIFLSADWKWDIAEASRAFFNDSK